MTLTFASWRRRSKRRPRGGSASACQHSLFSLVPDHHPSGAIWRGSSLAALFGAASFPLPGVTIVLGGGAWLQHTLYQLNPTVLPCSETQCCSALSPHVADARTAPIYLHYSCSPKLLCKASRGCTGTYWVGLARGQRHTGIRCCCLPLSTCCRRRLSAHRSNPPGSHLCLKRYNFHVNMQWGKTDWLPSLPLTARLERIMHPCRCL